jgi:hypothetical protein
MTVRLTGLVGLAREAYVADLGGTCVSTPAGAKGRTPARSPLSLVKT